MPQSIHSFDRINIPAPCNADWDSMIGNDRVRFCEHCNLQVSNLSAMTRLEATRLVARSEGRLCVRFVARPDGRIHTTEFPKKIHQIARRASRLAAGAFTATLSLSSAAVQAQSGTGFESRRETAVAASTAVPLAHEAALAGTVTDPMGAVVMGANVILSNKETGAAFVCVTGEDGSYNFSMLAPGRYTLTVDVAAFAPAPPIDLELSAASTSTRYITVEAPALTEAAQISSPRVRTIAVMGAMIVRQPESPLIKAAFSNDLDALVELIPTTIDINASDKATNTSALAYAVANNNLEMVEVLISAGGRPNDTSGGQPPLMHLTGDATVEFVRRLIGLGFDVKDHDNSGRSVLMHAARFSTFAVVKELIDAGAKIDERDNEGNTVLMSAAENSDTSILKFLIKSGVSVDRKNDDGDSALSLAAKDGQGENLKVLIDAGATVDLGQDDLNEALLLVARSEDAGTLKVLLKLGAKANAKDEDTTVLMLAAEHSTPEGIKALIDAGAEVDAVDGSGWTALMHANEAENVRVLLNAGANMAIKNNDGDTALAMAIQYEQEDVVRLLKSRGAPE